MLKVALTGGIATGKSYVLARLRERGVHTIDADEIVHECLRAGTSITNAIASQFGGAFVKADGTIDRALLGAKVFSDPDSRRRLEAIIHPAVYDRISNWYETLAQLKLRPTSVAARLAVASIPLLYETNRQTDFDLVVATVCPPGMQVQRIIERDGISEEAAQQRIAAQMPAAEKAARADYVIDTGGTMAETDRQVEALLLSLQTR